MKNFVVLLILVALTFSFKSNSQESSQINLDDFEDQSLDDNMSSLQNLKRNQKDDAEQLKDATPTRPTLIERITGGDNDLRIPQIDQEIGVQLDTYSTSNDSARASFSYLLSSNVKDAASLATLEFIYSKKMERIWLEALVSRTTAKTKRLTDYNSKIGTLSDAFKEENSDVTQFGFGASYRTTYIQNIINSPKLFETISALGTYNHYNDVASELSYAGFGLKTDVGLHHRFSPTFHLGAKISYNLAAVKSDAEFEGQSPNERSLLLRWVSFGADLSFYF